MATLPGSLEPVSLQAERDEIESPMTPTRLQYGNGVDMFGEHAPPSSSQQGRPMVCMADAADRSEAVPASFVADGDMMGIGRVRSRT
jgi:hypothetical protein